jgi:hypothetical protein
MRLSQGQLLGELIIAVERLCDAVENIDLTEAQTDVETIEQHLEKLADKVDDRLFGVIDKIEEVAGG